MAAILQAAALQWFAPLETLLSVDTVRESFSPPRGAPFLNVWLETEKGEPVQNTWNIRHLRKFYP